MANLELLKLIGILVGGSLVIVIGLIIQKKKLKQKKLEEEKMNSAYNHSSSSSNSNEEYNNEKIKSYIIQYKGTYPRDSVKTSLINAGNSESEVERYLNKFF